MTSSSFFGVQPGGTRYFDTTSESANTRLIRPSVAFS